ncbi:hypothetical protein ASPZODRAFT_16305 [Penicilliopsis zonata CBS 506.65]|uniref:Nephrocystin 3-like N-terminal domain-containing protein n=1 Tax=Penicilliopsis zonata CBS 506.65 TaxID=1073090 RepID=A0A1L9SHB8_9EURO|nr:hypothetical protein ASPZODRAFT_16305 [Penicilliopsis zonata CBS 506.65]OJJ46551.1 hypothetical protein ASPZODRAFT_16305 [Penicilliopsis zonata CBS 506.65]
MAPSLLVENGAHLASPLSPGGFPQWRRISGGILDIDSVSNGPARSIASRRVSRKTLAGGESSAISTMVYSLKRQSGDELGVTTSSKLLNNTDTSLLNWIRHQRMSKLPPEGSSYDKVLAWAQLFVERLRSFDLAIEHFVGDSYLAAQLAYGYCAILLELGEENASALKISFGFFYSTSMVLVNLLERTELFTVSQDIREQLVLALSDLVTLVARVSTYFHKALRGLSRESISINIYGTFAGQIENFRGRCDKIAEAMWKHQLLKDGLDGNRVSEVKTIQNWLVPEDRLLANVAETISHLAQDREELTCLWLGPYLTRFLNSKQLKGLSFFGKPGSGKTVLASVIVDHLQHPIGGVSYQTLFVPINSRIPAETNPRSVVKAVLRQLFEKRIGNVQLFQILINAYESSRKAITDEEYDKFLWDALEASLGAPLRGAKPLVIVVDGLDEVSGDEAALIQKLQVATSKASNLKLITLGSQALKSAPDHASIPIGADLIFDDIAAVVRNSFEQNRAFNSMSETEQEILIDDITQASSGSFLWAKLAVKQVRQEPSPEALQKAVASLPSSSKFTITDFVARTLQDADLVEDAKLMLIWLATAYRPLTLKELATLLSIHVDKFTVVEKNVDILRLLKPASSLVYLEDGRVYIRHDQIRSAILEVFSKGKLVPSIKDRHADLLRRLLVYVRLIVTEDHEPSLTALDRYDTNNLLAKHPLLDFSLRYWVAHLRRTSVFSADGEAGAAKEFGKIFPSNTTFVLLEKTVWEHKSIPVMLSWHFTLHRLYRHILTPNHIVTLQSIINLALLYRQIERFPDAAQFFYEAITVSRTVLAPNHIIAMQMASFFLEVTTDQITETKTEIMIKREETLLLLVECYKVHYGSTSEIVISTLTQLAEHYTLIKEEQKAKQIYISIRSATVLQYGADSQEVREISSSLDVRLKSPVTKTEIEVGTGLGLDIVEEDEWVETEKYDFVSLFQLAEKYIAEKQFALAERTFVEIWQRASSECRMNYSAEWEDRKVKTVLAYSKFLKSQKREYEASSLLTTVWQEYEQTSIATSETSISHLTEIAKVMKTVGLSALALTVYKRCAHHFESTSRTQTSSYKEIQQSIQSTSKEVMQSMSNSTTTVTSETTLEEMVYEASTTITTIDQSSITAVSTLFQTYVSQHRWHDATRMIKRVLHGIWPSLFAPSLADVTIPAKFVDHCVEMAERLSQCYHSRRRLTKEEDIRERIYRAVRSDRKVDDKLLGHVTAELLRLFERTTQPDKIISLRQEILADNIKHYGPHHTVVIQNLWKLAELTRPRPIFVDYYRQIVSAVNKDSEVCLPEAFEALVIVATELWNQGKYTDAVNYYKIIYNTFLKQHKISAKFEVQEFVQTFFTRYVRCLRTVQTDLTIIHTVTVDYHAKIKATFSATASITIQATLTLAKLCQESKRYEIEAIHLYEELLSLKSEEIDYQEITETLDSIYEEQAAIVTSTRSESVSSTQIERAVSVLKRRISSIRQTHGWAHEESLSKMQEMVSFYSKRNESETVVKELKEATVQILSTELSSTRLIAAASTIAASYIASGQVHRATELSQEMYRQIIMKDTANVKSVQFDLTSKERQSLVFLAQLEYSLRENSSVTLNEIFSALTTEYVYFEEFRSQTKSTSSSLHTVSVSAARLHGFLLGRNRQATATRVFEEFTSYFLATVGKQIKLIETPRVRIFIQTILDYFSVHASSNFVRSIGIASRDHVRQLIAARKYEAACDLAYASFRYISTQEGYQTAGIVKLVFQLGMSVSGRDASVRADEASHKKMLAVSAVIMQDALRVIKGLKINLAQVDFSHLNSLIGLLGEQQDYKTLAWLLTLLWNSREAQRTWQSTATLALGRRFILVRYLVGEMTAALRLAEDIVYNCRRVHGARHPNTLDMSVLLSQLYSSAAQRYLAQKGGQEMAHRYFRKAAAVHENILRVFSDPMYAELEGGGDSMHGMDESIYSVEMGGIPANGAAVASGVVVLTDGEYVRRHLYLLKLAVERLGDWPKEYGEYERLNKDVFREFNKELAGVEGVEKWNLKEFGSGKAESNADLLDLTIKDWEVVDTAVKEEEEL